MTTQLTTKFDEALLYATHLHRHQKRKVDNTPYVGHLLAVCALILEAGGSEDQAIAGLLHDAIEDQKGSETRQQILEKFGAQISYLIDSCTESEIIPKPPWQQRKNRYLSQLQTAAPAVRLISLADKLHNARSLLAALKQKGETGWQFFNAGKQQTLWFYRNLLEIYQQTEAPYLVEEFAQIICELEKY